MTDKEQIDKLNKISVELSRIIDYSVPNSERAIIFHIQSLVSIANTGMIYLSNLRYQNIINNEMYNAFNFCYPPMTFKATKKK